MKPSSARENISRPKARNAALMNLLATPGLGSLMAGRVIAGMGQLALSVSGFVLVLVWFMQEMVPYYSLMFSDEPQHPVGFKMLKLGAGLFALAWLWSLVTSVSLFRETSKSNLASLKNFAAGQNKMDEPKIQTALAALPQWQRNGQIISRTFVFTDFPAAMKFVNAVAEIAELAQHHPDIDVRWNQVTLALTTHDAGGLTEKDFALARQCDALAKV
jgi:4a-hydroxytetrahydrobiopterin dehydratase